MLIEDEGMNKESHYLCFLDFDGVTHPVSANERYFRAENIFPLIECLLFIDVYIVITSTWRLDMDISEIKFLLGPLGKRVIGQTPEINDPFLHFVRQAEVESYLDQTNQQNTSWFAIDDTAAFFQPDAPLLLIDGKAGFCNKDCFRLHEMISTLELTNNKTKPKDKIMSDKIYARINDTSKYAYQDTGEPFSVCLSNEPRMIADGYYFEGGPGGNYRAEDLVFYSRTNESFKMITKD